MLGTIPVTDILDMLTPDYEETSDALYVRDVLDHKRTSPHYAALLDGIRTDGITIPVVIRAQNGTPWLEDGHHRIAAAIDAGLTAVPFTDDHALVSRIESMQWKLAPAALTPAAIEAFTRGACGGLAIALHDATGWPLIEVGHCDGLPLHFMVRHPDGHLVDIRGRHTDDDIRDEWEFDADDGVVTLTVVTRDNVMNCYLTDCGEPVPMELAHTFAPAVLARL